MEKNMDKELDIWGSVGLIYKIVHDLCILECHSPQGPRYLGSCGISSINLTNIFWARFRPTAPTLGLKLVGV